MGVIHHKISYGDFVSQKLETPYQIVGIKKAGNL